MNSRQHHSCVTIASVVSAVLRALPVCAPMAVLQPALTWAQPELRERLQSNIPVQPLAQALAAFADATGLQLVYLSGLVGDQKSSAASAGLKPDVALTRLLRGTGLRFEYLTPSSVRILGSLPPRKATPGADDRSMDEVIVTASRRTEYPHNVPIAIEVLSGATLAELNATSFEDFVGYLPNVVAHGVGPSQNTIYMRGLGTTDGGGLQAAGTNGIFPNVAVYLDEQSGQLPGRNLDIYAADLERIEVLPGPQGTQFGAGAEAGVVRYVTNKPKINVTEAIANARYAVTAHGAPSDAGDLAFNVPLIEDKLSLRGVVYSDQRGGYLDNLPATFARAPTDRSIGWAGAGGRVPLNSVVLNNWPLVGKDVNPLTYQGLRIASLYEVTDTWNVLLSQSYQRMEADGVFAEAVTDGAGVPQPPLSVQLYNPAYDRDAFENTALTVHGRAGPLDVLYAGSYLVRNVSQVQDYTNYARGGPYVDYYQCVNPGPTAATARCFSPSSTWRNIERNTHHSQELRLSSPPENRVRGLVGLFYDNHKLQDQGDFYYLTALPYFKPIGPPTGYFTVNGQYICGCAPPNNAVFVPYPVTSSNPNVRPLGDAFFNDVARTTRQEAVFMSVDTEIMPRTLTLTTGTRYFRDTLKEVGSSVGSFGCGLLQNPNAASPCLNREAVNLDFLGFRHSFSGFKSRANLSWRPQEQVLIYYTWSQGMRVGGYNRPYYGPPSDSPLSVGDAKYQAVAKENRGWATQVYVAPDTLVNNEIGWKTSWLAHHLQWDGAIYQEKWDRAQLTTGGLGSSGYVNGGNYRVRGIETSLVGRLGGLTMQFGGAWNHGVLTKEADLYWSNGALIDFSRLRDATGAVYANPTGTLGSQLSGAPPAHFNLRARYEIDITGVRAFAQMAAIHQAHSLASTDTHFDLQGHAIDYNLAPYTTYAASLGVTSSGWLVELYGENLNDTRADLFENDNLGYRASTINRPRTLGLHVSYRFGGT